MDVVFIIPMESNRRYRRLDKNGYIVAGEEGITSAKGFFAAGDVRTKKLRQVSTAVSDGANCVISAEEYLQLTE